MSIALTPTNNHHKMRNLFIAIFLFSPLFLVAQEAAPANADDALQDTVKLKEVVIKVSRPISKIEGDGFVTQIQGSVLQELGTAKDVLGFIPGIQNNNGAISVIGCGVPTIYINGRMVRTGQELDQLRANKMKTVKLITNPGARYDGQTNAVIRITTVKNLGDGFALDSRTSLSFRNYLGGREDVSLNYRHNNLDIFGTLEYDYNKGKGSMTEIQDSWMKTHNRSMLNTDTHRKSQIYDGKIGFNYSPSEQHHFGAYYHTSHQPARVFRHSSSRFYQNDIMVDNSLLSAEISQPAMSILSTPTITVHGAAGKPTSHLTLYGETAMKPRGFATCRHPSPGRCSLRIRAGAVCWQANCI